MQQILSELLFLGQRFNRKSFIDILIVAIIFFIFLRFVRGTQANTLMRGTIIIFIIISLLYVLVDLPALTWLISGVLPVLLIVVPVVFAPEIRRAFERMGHVQSFRDLLAAIPPHAEEMSAVIDSVVTACSMLSARNHGALIVMQRFDDLEKYANTGVMMDTIITPEILMQIFYPNTPLHDGAVIISKGRIWAAACIMPLSSRNVLDKLPGRQMGLRHRAALGISEANDSITIVVSEETGSLSVAYEGRITRGISAERLKVTLESLYEIPEKATLPNRFWKFITYTVNKVFRRAAK